MHKRGYLEISFSWMFALIVGAVILFLAIFFLTRFINTQQQVEGVKTASEIQASLNTLELGFEESKAEKLSASVDTRIYSSCDNSGYFGHQGIMVKEKVYGNWPNSGFEVTSQNKYLFSERPVEGRNFFLFSKNFELPFEIASLIYLTPQDKGYCFVDPPSDIEEEIKNLNGDKSDFNLNLKDSDEIGCSEEDLEVCFDSYSPCDINVDNFDNTVEKDGDVLYFEGNSLMYAAIFSEPSLYECQVQRLMKRAEVLSNIYKEKLLLNSYQGCSGYLLEDLNELSEKYGFYQGSEDLSLIFEDSENLRIKNKNPACRLW